LVLFPALERSLHDGQRGLWWVFAGFSFLAVGIFSGFIPRQDFERFVLEPFIFVPIIWFGMSGLILLKFFSQTGLK